MFCVSALYPNTPGSRFDAAYYVGPHTALARRLLGPGGLTDIRVTIGNAALDGAAPPYWVISEMHFTSRSAFDATMGEHGAALFADAADYTDVTPVLQVSTLAD